eukprot:355346-Chlamydomonas_euryale.AAC.3
MVAAISDENIAMCCWGRWSKHAHMLGGDGRWECNSSAITALPFRYRRVRRRRCHVLLWTRIKACARASAARQPAWDATAPTRPANERPLQVGDGA